MANLSNVINVALLPEGATAERDNMNVCMIVTSDTGFLSTAVRYKAYSDIDSVATDFGTTSDAYQHALIFFQQTPNPINAGGILYIGYWRAADENVAATAAVLTGGQVTEDTLIPLLQAVSDGSFDIDVDGGTVNVTALDFRTVTTIEEVVSLLDTAITGATVTYENQRLVVTSNTTGVTSTISLVTEGATGTYVGSTLALSAGTGASKVDGADATVITAESKVEAVTALKAEVNFKGFVFAGATSDAESEALATWTQANNTMSYDVFSDPSNLNVDVTNPVWKIKLANQNQYRMMYNKGDDRRMATAYMARLHTVNFAATNTAITMNLKELVGIVAEDFTQTEINSAQTVGLDIYTTFKNVSKLLVSGANDFADNPYNLLAFIDAIQTDLFNLLGGTATKIPQTIPGVNQEVDIAEKTCQQYVNAGVFAPGTWTSPDRFGEQEIFDSNIENKGYYVLAGQLSDQSQADRVARKSPVIEVAVKNAGAIHQVDLIVRFNK